MYILGIESSCDDTCAAVVKDGRELLSNCVASSAAEQNLYGGVVPEIASRRHIEHISQVARAALDEAGTALDEIGGVAVTFAPGLIGAVLVGLNFAKGLALSAQKPLIPVHHLRGHIAALYLTHPELEPPFLCLVASGGHSHIVRVQDYTHFEVLGRTVDDAAGEAFDKVARTLGLGYPGGPAVSRAAQTGDPKAYPLPTPHVEGPYNVSFSGLKTFAANTIRDNGTDDQTRADIARAFEDAVVDTLMIKCKRALDQTGFKRLVMAGGVSANRTLRAKLAEMMKKRRGEVFYARPEFCTDNGAMIAYAGMVRFKAGATADLGVSVRPRWPLAELPAA